MKKLLKQFIVTIIVTIVVLSMYTCVAQAAALGPEEPQKQPIALVVSDTEIDMLARLVWAEARGVESTMEQAAVIWCVLNRVDAGYSDGSIEGVVTAPYQFAYSKRAPITDELHELAVDVTDRWVAEKRGVEDVGRVLPSNYLYFAGHGGHNWFRCEYRGGEYWGWSLPDPYTEE